MKKKNDEISVIFVICLSGNRHTRLSIVMIHILRLVVIFSPFESNPKTRKRIFPNLWSELNFLGQNCIEFAKGAQSIWIVRQFQSINNHAPNLVRITRSYECAIFCGIRRCEANLFCLFPLRDSISCLLGTLEHFLLHVCVRAMLMRRNRFHSPLHPNMSNTSPVIKFLYLAFYLGKSQWLWLFECA